MQGRFFAELIDLLLTLLQHTLLFVDFGDRLLLE